MTSDQHDQELDAQQPDEEPAPSGTCPPWCQQHPGHEWDTLHEGRLAREHFREFTGNDLPAVTVTAWEFLDVSTDQPPTRGTTPPTVTAWDSGLLVAPELTVEQALDVAAALRAAAQFVTELAADPAPNN